MAGPQTKKEKYEALNTQLETVKAGFVGHWTEISDFIQPRRTRFNVTDANRGDRRNQKIIDAAASRASRTLKSGMMSGLTSPSRVWFNFTFADKDLLKRPAVKRWLYDVREATAAIFTQSNLYSELPSVYGDSGDFATAAMLIEEDFDGRVISTQSLPIGSYKIGLGRSRRVEVFVRDFTMTCLEMVQTYGKKTGSGQPDWSIFSPAVKQAWDAGNYATAFIIRHVIQPNEDYEAKSPLSAKMRYSSCYYEPGDNSNRLLSESGYSYFPVVVPRWEVTGEDAYGTNCPGMMSLGEVKALQLMHRKKAQVIQKQVDPPMQAPISMKGMRSSIISGDINFLSPEDMRAGGMRPAHEVKPELQGMLLDIQDIREAIDKNYYTDIFRSILDTDRRDMTAREVEERHQEKIGEMAPVLERFNLDLLNPLVDITYMMAWRQHRYPPPPPEIQGNTMVVEYISIMHEAQKALGLAGMERLTQYALSLAPALPQVFDYFNEGEAMRTYADMTTVYPTIIRSDDEVGAIRQARAKQQQAQQAAAMAQQQAQAAKNLSGADMGGDNALTRMVSDAQAGQLQASQ